MDYAGTLATLAGVMALSAISPGPNFVIVSSTAMRVSRRAGLLAGLGLAGASLTWTLLAISGLGLLLSHAAWVYQLVRVVGALYLIYIGVKMVLGARKPLDLSVTDRQITPYGAMRKAYLVSMGNPKSIAFYGSIFALMVPPAPLCGSMALPSPSPRWSRPHGTAPSPWCFPRTPSGAGLPGSKRSLRP